MTNLQENGNSAVWGIITDLFRNCVSFTKSYGNSKWALLTWRTVYLLTTLAHHKVIKNKVGKV